MNFHITMAARNGQIAKPIIPYRRSLLTLSESDHLPIPKKKPREAKAEMTDVTVATAVRKAVEVAGNLVVDEGSRLYWLPEEMRWLESQLRHMQAYVAAAEAKLVTDPQVENLVKDIRDLAEDVKDILGTFVPKVESHRSRGIIGKTACIFPYWLTCSNLAREIGKIRRRVEAIDATRKSYGIQDAAAIGADRINDPRVDALHIDEPVVVGINKDIAELKMKLLSEEEELLFVSIVGMPGIGKTTLAKKVFKSVKDQFDCCAMVYVSQEPNVEDLLLDIAEQVGLPEGMRKRNLKRNLYDFLQGQWYVLLLDDIWRTEVWNEFKTSFPIDNENGSRIIITSRHMDVGRYIGDERSLHLLQPFDPQTSWNLFTKLIVPSLNTGDNQGLFENSTLGNLGKKIVKRCGGVALAIVVTVGMLRERGTNEFAWNQVLKSIGHDSRDKCSQILALSYRDLPFELKPCFLYLGIFPEDYEMYVSELIRLWMAEKFIDSSIGFEPEDIGEDYMSKLAARNLVQVVSKKFDEKIKCIRVHDLLHSLCMNISHEINFFHIFVDNPNPRLVTRACRFSIHPNTNMNITLNNRILKVRTILFFNSRQETSRKPVRKTFATEGYMC